MRTRGFSLLEVVIALGILGIGLAALLESQIGSISTVDRSRSLTIATLLARSKMVDIEHHLVEGFKLGEEEDRGTFEPEGHSEIKWSYRIKEVKLDLTQLSGLAGGAEEGQDSKDDKQPGSAQQGGLPSDMNGIGQLLGLDQISNGLRMVEMTITWPDAGYEDHMTVRALVARPYFDTADITGIPP